MGMNLRQSARFLAGAFLLCAGRLAAEPIRVAAERPDARCPGQVLGIVRAGEGTALPSDAARCVAILTVSDLTDAALEAAAARAAKIPPAEAAIVEITSAPDPANPEWAARFSYAVKKLSSAIRGASPGARVGYDLTSGIAAGQSLLLANLELAPYVDAFIRRPDRGS
ncbi:MAG TPA: hypothetical protein VK780_03860, partial [Thermoanaerobaculia bacterium]|nr:hypothetical protein [Thermoanaerobaculia bacterium]